MNENRKPRKDYLIPNFKNHLPAVTPPVYERYTKEELEEIIEKNFGITTIICSLVDCTYKQLYNALDKYELRDCLTQAKKNLVSLAEKAILDCLLSESEKIRLDAAQMTLRSLGKTEGWGTDTAIINQQINLQDKQTEIKNIFGINEN